MRTETSIVSDHLYMLREIAPKKMRQFQHRFIGLVNR